MQSTAEARTEARRHPPPWPAEPEPDIATITAEIRKEWSPQEERRRRSWSVTPCHVPHCLDR